MHKWVKNNTFETVYLIPFSIKKRSNTVHLASSYIVKKVLKVTSVYHDYTKYSGTKPLTLVILNFEQILFTTYRFV